MYFKRGLILIVFLLVVPIVYSDFDFQCEDGTLFGECNENGEICAGSENLIDNIINLTNGHEYLFFGETSLVCDDYMMGIGNKSWGLILSLQHIKEVVTSEFISSNDLFNGKLRFYCFDRETLTSTEFFIDKKYLGDITEPIDNPELFEDCNFCGKCRIKEIPEPDLRDGFGTFIFGIDNSVNFSHINTSFSSTSAILLYTHSGEILIENKLVNKVWFDTDGNVFYDDGNIIVVAEDYNFRDWRSKDVLIIDRMLVPRFDLGNGDLFFTVPPKYGTEYNEYNELVFTFEIDGNKLQSLGEIPFSAEEREIFIRIPAASDIFLGLMEEDYIHSNGTVIIRTPKLYGENDMVVIDIQTPIRCEDYENGNLCFKGEACGGELLNVTTDEICCSVKCSDLGECKEEDIYKGLTVSEPVAARQNVFIVRGADILSLKLKNDDYREKIKADIGKIIGVNIVNENENNLILKVDQKDNEESVLIFTENGITSFETYIIGSYIFELEEEPLMTYEKNIEEEVKVNERKSDFEKDILSTINIILPKEREFTFDSNMEDKLLKHKENIVNEHNKFLEDVENILDKPINEITGSIVFSEPVAGTREIKPSGEYFNSINGFNLKVSREEVDEIKSRLNVKKVYRDKKVRNLLNDTVSSLNVDQVWQLDSKGRKCLETGEECLTGRGVNIGIIDTGVDYNHPDLGNGCYGGGEVIVENLAFVVGNDAPASDTVAMAEIMASFGRYPNMNSRRSYLDSEISNPLDYNLIIVSTKGEDRYYNSLVNNYLVYDDFQYASIQMVRNGNNKVILVLGKTNSATRAAASILSSWNRHPSDGNILCIEEFDGETFIDSACSNSNDPSLTLLGYPRFFLEKVSDCKVVGGYDFINNDDDPMDDHGHGTHVAATVAGKGTLTGVAPDAKIYAYKVLDYDGGGSSSSVISGIEVSMDPNRDRDTSDHLDIISLSLGGAGDPDDSVSKAIDNAIDVGIVAVIAAGNSGPNYYTIGSPGTSRKAITVGAINKNNEIAEFSSRGPVIYKNEIIIKPDVLAPGVDICAAQWADAFSRRGNVNCNNDDLHVAISGTSMATPHVSGITALLKQAHPEWTPFDFKSALVNNAIDLNYDENTQGGGKINPINSINPSLIINPSILNFGINNNEATLKIKNMKSEVLNLEISSDNIINNDKLLCGELLFKNQIVTIGPNEELEIPIILHIRDSLWGDYYGNIYINDGEREYRVPFSFGKFLRLRLDVDVGEGDIEHFVYLHNTNFDYIDSSTITEPKEFWVNPGNYVVYAMGPMGKEIGFNYVLYKDVNLINRGEDVTLSLRDARPFNVKGTSFSGEDLEYYGFELATATYINLEEIDFYASLSYPSREVKGDTILYLSDKPRNVPNVDVSVDYIGVPTEDD